MHITLTIIAVLAASVLAAAPAAAGSDDFHGGAVITDFGQIATIDADMLIPKGAVFKVAFDTAKSAEAGTANRTLNSAARFLNMHHEAGVAEENMRLAVVFHGQGAFDLTTHAYYSSNNDGAQNASAPLIKALKAKGVRLILCGQTAAYRDISKTDLLPGVEVALSAMTAHALLQQEGYTLNPF